MRKLFALAFLIAPFLFGVASAGNFGSNSQRAWGKKPAAKTNAPAAAAGKIVPYNGTFKLTRVNDFAGTCPDGYANQCASGDCECVEFSGTGGGSAFGKSSNVAFEITVDLGNQPGDPDGTCFPGFGVMSLDGSKDTGEVVDVMGAACNNISGTSTFTGGFTFDKSSSTLFDGQGPTALGKFLGNDTFQLKLKGKACKGTAQCT